MNIKTQFQDGHSARDQVFQQVFFYLNGQPAKILEIGCLRDLKSRAGDGWSTLHWADYVEKYGGKLAFCNIDKDALDLCESIIVENFKINYWAEQKDGLRLIDGSYKFIYLDGGDCPHETYKQFQKCDTLTQYVLIDDFHTKGKVVDREWRGNKTLFRFNNGHKMALFGPDVINEEIVIHV
jgi:hypothetical protein